MSLYILPLSDPAATLDLVGGKGASLARLAAAGLPVPDGFHITTVAYRQFLVDNNLQAGILLDLQKADASDAASLEAASVSIARRFQQGVMSAAIAAAIANAYTGLGGGDLPVAVRSSATAEDLPEMSFAGQMETYLNVQGEPLVLESVKRCWASLWTARAIGYRMQRSIDQNTVSLAVVVQKLVAADASGIMFTANPVTGLRHQIAINAAWGLGEAVVGGLVTPDMLLVESSTGRVIQRDTALKLRMTVRIAGGTAERAVPKSKQRAFVLDNASAADLARIGVQIENLYGAPMDIEWARADKKFVLLQARLITALPQPPLVWISPYPKALLMRASFAEFVPEPVSPLFGTLAVPMAAETGHKLMEEYMGTLEADSYPFAVVNGYVYIGMALTRKMFTAMIVAALSGAIQKMLRTSQMRWMAKRENFHAAIASLQQKDPAALSPTELWQAAKDIFFATAEYYTVAQSGPIPAASGSELSFGRFYHALVKRKCDPEASLFLLGLDTLAWRAEKSLFDLAQWIQTQPALAQHIMSTSAQEICGEWRTRPARGGASPEWTGFYSRLDDHLKEYGHTVYDLDFAKPVPADDPSPLVAALQGYLEGKGGDPYARQQAMAETRGQAERLISARLDPLRRKWFRQLLGWAQDCAPKREDCIADLGWGYPLLRKLLRELGARLAKAGALRTADDVYWLEAEEVEAMTRAVETGEALPDCGKRVELRKHEWQREREATAPAFLPERSLFARLMARDDPRSSTLKGAGASGGRVTARACILRDPKDFDRMRPGDVIVAVTTTPAWTPLFAMASAVVTDIGGPLSHSSIVAREYGIPAVLGTGNATRRIGDGQIITVDGSAGRVYLPQVER